MSGLMGSAFLATKLYSAVKTAAATGIGALVLMSAPIPWKQIMSKNPSNLDQVFKLGKIYFVDSEGNIKYPKVIRNTPIHRGYEIEFSVPTGLDPAIVERKYWLFEQAYGAHIELVRSSNRYVLRVYDGPLPDGKDIPYNYKEFLQYVEEMSFPIVVGEGRQGFVAYDMKPNPNLLVTGEPGSGKSSLLRAVLTFLIQHFSPKQLHIHLVDMKWSEFHIFKRCEHVKSWTAEEAGVLKMLRVVERQALVRSKFLDRYHVTHIDNLPRRIRRHLPYALIAIDEVAVLGLKITDEIAIILDKLASQGRALGIYCMLSMQRADADALPGRTKNHFTVRASFKQSDDVNERVAGAPGAADIDTDAKGRMIFAYNGFQQVQAPWLDESEAEKIVSQWYRPLEVKKRKIKYKGPDIAEPEENIGDSIPTLVRDQKRSWAEEFPPSSW